MAKGFPISGTTAVVTGAASGIGAALAEALASRGAHLALADKDADGLEATAARLRSNARRVSVHALDLSDRDAPEALLRGVREAHGGAGLLFNVAGIAAGGGFEDTPEQNFDRVMEVNFNATVRLTRAFLPLLREGPEGRVVNISSVFGIAAPAGHVAYSASKFAVRGFSEGLRHELDGSRVGVSVVHPGGVRTAIARSALTAEDADAQEIAKRTERFERNLRMAPEKAAGIILAGVERRKARILVGADARMLDLTARLFPGAYWKILRLVMSRTDRS